MKKKIFCLCQKPEKVYVSSLTLVFMTYVKISISEEIFEIYLPESSVMTGGGFLGSGIYWTILILVCFPSRETFRK